MPSAPRHGPRHLPPALHPPQYDKGLTIRQQCIGLSNCCERGRLQSKLPSAAGLQVLESAILLVACKQRRCYRKQFECQLATPTDAPGRRRRRDSHECSPPLLLRKQDFSFGGVDEFLKLFNLRSVIQSLITVMPKGLQREVPLLKNAVNTFYFC